MRVGLISVAIAVATACGSSGDPGSRSGCGTNSAAPSASSSASPVLDRCGPLREVSLVDLVAAPGEPAPGTGGRVADGTYVLTAATLYGSGGPDGPVRQVGETVTIAGSAVSATVVDQRNRGGARRTSTLGGKATFEGSTVTIAYVCPQPATRSGSYSATDTTLTLVFPLDEGEGSLEARFTRR